MARLEQLPQIREGETEGGYRAVVFDLDGTLYNQKKLRLIMAARLGLHYLIRPLKIRELLWLKTFRKVRDNWEAYEQKAAKDAGTLDEKQYACVAKIHGTMPENVETVIRRWIYEKPLSALEKCVDKKIRAYIFELRKNHIPVFIFSDYPIEDKLNALKITADGMYAPGDERAIELKPSPMGLKLIMKEHGLTPEQILMVGDRDVKDGEAARRADVDYVIL